MALSVRWEEQRRKTPGLPLPFRPNREHLQNLALGFSNEVPFALLEQQQHECIH